MEHLMSAYGRLPVSMSHGKGANLWDTEGREYVDALSGISVCNLGHARPDIASALADQATKLLHISNLYREPLQEELAQRLCTIAGMDKAFFCNSGAEANEASIKIARLQGHKKNIEAPVIVVAETAFHGRTLATIAATGNTKVREGFGQTTPGFVYVPYNDIAAIKALASERDDIVAVLMEPLQGEGGIRVPDENYLNQLRDLCTEQGWLMMLDEIQAGMGRTGKWFAHQHNGIVPDVMSVAKALGNGMPIGACLAHGAAAELIQPGSHGTTFGGNPFACRAGLSVIDAIEKEQLIERAAELGERMMQGFNNRLHNRDGVKEVRGKGLMIGIELNQPCAVLVEKALEKGFLINVAAGNVVRLLPPYVLTNEQADAIVETVSELIIDFTSESV